MFIPRCGPGTQTERRKKMNNLSKGTKTNGETFIELLGKMRLYMEVPPHMEHDGDDISMRFSREWWERPVGHRRCAQCGEWFEAARKSHIYCPACGEKRRKEAQSRFHNAEPYITYRRVCNRLRARGEDTRELRAKYTALKTKEEKMRFITDMDESTRSGKKEDKE